LENAILKALAKSPEDRYAHMRDMVADLELAQEAILAMQQRKPLQSDQTMHHATMQIDLVQSFLSGPRFVVVATGATLPIPHKDEVLIGRADPRGNVIPDIDLSMYGGGSAGVSRQHARLMCQDDKWTIEDLRSTNGTYVNNQPVPSSQPTPLKDGDSVRCGQLVLTFYSGESQ
jgi:pSer/pThr/pTyr-binding forkhead associated (FHA) protein